jgi:hypothetical protein
VAIMYSKLSRPKSTTQGFFLLTKKITVQVIPRVLGPLFIRAHLELSPLALEVGLNFSSTLQSGS